MKKILVVLSFLCLAVACAPDSINQTDEDSVSVTTLRATLMGGSETRTEFGRSTISDSYSEIKWKQGDQINVFSSNNSAIFETQDNDVTAVFTLVSGDALSGNSFLGLSPYDPTASADVSSKTIHATIPVEQKASVDSFDPSALLAVGYTSNIENQMAFYNVCTGLRFTLSGSDVSKYKSIEFSGRSNEKVAGPVSISCSSASAPVASPEDGSFTYVTLVPSNGKFEKNKTYYILFRPGVFKDGFSLVFKDAEGNSLTDPCVCSSYVEFKSSVFPKIDGVDDPAKLAAIRDGDLLSKDGAANCYIVSKPGSYKFPLSRATENEFLSGITKVKVLWETDNSSGPQTENSIIANVGTNKKYVYFEVPNPMKEGNALIAAYHNNNIVWSWHIWVCNFDPVSTRQTYVGKSAAMMDRNLGALSASRRDSKANGLFYQWGRKDPFPGAVEDYVSNPTGGHFMKSTAATWPKLVAVENVSSGVTVEYGAAHPDTFFTTTSYWGDWLTSYKSDLWYNNGSKSIYDPCPAGWKVPRAFVLNSSNQHDTALEAWNAVSYQRVGNSGSGYGVLLDLASGGQAWYPNNGYISNAGVLTMVGQYSCYWSNSPNGQFTYAMEMSQSASTLTYNPVCYGKARGVGHSVRCVEDK